MSKRYRLAIILVIMAICFVFLWPTVRWYFLTPRDQQALALESREQIKIYASRTAQADLQRLITIAQENGDVPEELSFLVTQAKKIYKDSKQASPEHWDAKTTLSAFNSRREALDAIETRHRERVFALKDLQRGTAWP